MLLRTRLYLLLNSLVGTPQKVTRENYTRTEEIFVSGTLPLLASVERYVAATSRVLIVGCGHGGEIRWFAERAASVVAIDIDSRSIEQARKSTAALHNVECCLIQAPALSFSDGEFDVIFMHNVCEHIIELEQCFREYHRVLRRDGILINSCAPLFYSPYGAHLQDALKLPWGHLIFGVRSVVEVRNRFYPGEMKSTTWEELILNRLTERRYRQTVARCGFVDEHYELHTSKNLPLVAKVPLLRNLFIMKIVNFLRRSDYAEDAKAEAATSRRMVSKLR